MPTVISTAQVRAFAHCPIPRCPGNAQEVVDATREEVGVTFAERGGDAGGFENTTVRLNFVDPEQRSCPHCKRDRELSEQRRPVYESAGMGQPSDLLRIKPEQDGWL